MKKNRMYMKILAIFLLVLLIFTFFSKSIYNYNLPEASVAFPMQGELKHDIEGSAAVAYQDTWEVYAEEDGRISEIPVHPGDRVQAGDVLLLLKKNGQEEPVEVPAPRAGIIRSVGMQEGMYVSDMQNEPLVQMAEFNGMWRAELSVDEEAAAGIANGCPAELEIPGVLGVVQGTVAMLQPAGQEEGRGYTAVIEFACAEEGICGKQASAVIPIEGETYTGILPSYALHKDKKGYFVWTLTEETNILGSHYVVHRLSVDLLDTDESVSAVMGLREKEPVITSCTEELEEGSRVAYKESAE